MCICEAISMAKYTKAIMQNKTKQNDKFFDFIVQVYDGSLLVDVICGKVQPALTTTTSHFAVLKFNSNKRIRGEGFSVLYAIIGKHIFSI